jgi:type VI secretion system Hcp family effector
MRSALKILAASMFAVLVAVASVSYSVGTQAAPVASAAQSDYLLQLDGVGSDIEVQSFSWGVSSPRDTASGLPTGRRQYQPLIIRKRIDKASPLLFRAADTGQAIKTATFTGQGSDGTSPFKLSLSNVMISSFTEQNDPGSPPVENITFTFQKIEMK